MSATIIVTDKVTLKDVMRELLAEMGFAGSVQDEPVRPKQDEVNTKLAKAMLGDKGYQVTSCKALNKLLGEHDVKGTQRGKENWYKTADIERIPSRK